MRSGAQQKLTGVNAAATQDAKIIRTPSSCGMPWTPCRLSLPPHRTEVEVHVSTCAQVSKSKSSPAGQVLLKRPWTSVAWTIGGSRCPVHSGTRRCRYSKREKHLWMSRVLCRTRLPSTHPYPRLHCAIKVDHAYMSMYIYIYTKNDQVHIYNNYYIPIITILHHRRKFRSQTSDNMDRWKAEQGRGREKKRLEERRVEEKE